MYFGNSLNRLIHYIISLQLHLSTTKNLIAKTDLKDAYRCVTLHGDAAARCIINFGDLILLSLQLTFGGTPCPNEFCIISEIITDLAKDILHCQDWDPLMLHSPHTISLRHERDTHITDPFMPGKDLDVNLPLDTSGKVEIYINGGITVIPNIDNNRLRGSNAMALTIHMICRPISDQEPVHHDDCLSLSKLAEEGMLSESAIVLGWKINTRSLLLSLPPDKFNSWSLDIKGILANKKATQEELEMLIGRLNHTAAHIPQQDTS